jgi:hypothetical protein
LCISQPLPHTIFYLPPSVGLCEVLRGRTSGRTDRLDIHDCLFSSTFDPVRKERRVEPSSRVILLGTFLSPDISPLPPSSPLSLSRISLESPHQYLEVSITLTERSLPISSKALKAQGARLYSTKQSASTCQLSFLSFTTFTNLRHHAPFGTVSLIFGQGYLPSSLSHLPSSIFQHPSLNQQQHSECTTCTLPSLRTWSVRTVETLTRIARSCRALLPLRSSPHLQRYVFFSLFIICAQPFKHRLPFLHPPLCLECAHSSPPSHQRTLRASIRIRLLQDFEFRPSWS